MAQGGDFGVEKLVVYKEKIEIDAWAEHHQLGVLRDVLQGGLDIHIRDNPNVRSILGLGDAPQAARRRRLADKVCVTGCRTLGLCYGCCAVGSEAGASGQEQAPPADPVI